MVNVAVATFDPSANTAQRPIAAYGLGVYIPSKAIITRAWVDVVTTFTSAGADAGTIALHVQAADDIVAAIAISDATNVWDAGIHGSIGPWVVTADELPAGGKGLKIETRLNGTVMQSDNTDNMMFPVAETITYVTLGMTLEPGDIIVTGTPSGVGGARKPPVWMGMATRARWRSRNGMPRNPIEDEKAAVMARPRPSARARSPRPVGHRAGAEGARRKHRTGRRGRSASSSGSAPAAAPTLRRASSGSRCREFWGSRW